MKTYLGVDGGGSKTRFLLIDEAGKVLAAHTEGSAYHLEIGLAALEALLARFARKRSCAPSCASTEAIGMARTFPDFGVVSAPVD